MELPRLNTSNGELTRPAETGVQDSSFPAYTGRYLVTLRPDATEDGIALLQSRPGMRLAEAGDFEGSAVRFEELGDADALVLREAGVAVVAAPPDQMEFVTADMSENSPILAVEPEPVVYALGSAPAPMPLPERQDKLSADAELAYLRGYREAVNYLVDWISNERAGDGQAVITEEMVAQAAATWGLLATGVTASPRTGLGIRVAVLDTGMDLRHPDFTGRPMTANSFIPGEAVQDGHGHGTHCAGTACGPRTAGGGQPRYGVAYQAALFVGKVLSNSGSGTGGSVIAGINWAIANRCDVISMSLGSPVAPGQGFLQAYEQPARIALQRNLLMIAAAGNDSRRSQGRTAPVGSPANCPSILSVAAVDLRMRVAEFSNRAMNLAVPGGKVDIAGPGVDVLSSWSQTASRMPGPYRTISGTSMATPHVAGIAALYAQSSPALRGAALWRQLAATARPLPGLLAVDVGAGLVRA